MPSQLFLRLAVDEYLDDLLDLAGRNPGECFRQLLQVFSTWRSYRVLRVLNALGRNNMARGKGAKSSGAAPKSQQWTTFVDIPVSADDWPIILKEYGAPESLSTAMEVLVGNGYRVSFSYSPANDAVICALTCKDEESVNNGMTMTSFAGTWADALMVAAYKHFVVSKQNWTQASITSDRRVFG